MARDDFSQALHYVLERESADRTTGLPSNPKIAAVCHIRIAQCYARELNEAKAREHYAEWEVLRAHVEHAWVREKAAEVKAEIDSLSMHFFISAHDPNAWNYTDNVVRLRRWLLTQALRQTRKNYLKAAALIGVQRATLYQWQDDSRKRSKRARISGNSTKALKEDEK